MAMNTQEISELLPGDQKDSAILAARLRETLMPALFEEYVRVEGILRSMEQLGRSQVLRRVYRDARVRMEQQRQQFEDMMAARLALLAGDLLGEERADRAERQMMPGDGQNHYMDLLANGDADMEEIIIDRPYFGDLDEEQDEGAADTPDPEDPMLARVRALPLGCWLEFRRPDGHVYQARLAWVNKVNGVYMFMDADGIQQDGRAPEVLAAELRSGRVRVMDRDEIVSHNEHSLLDRAVGSLVGGFRRRRQD